jgi:hypothetical protein
MVVASTWKISRNRKACASGFSPDEKKIRLHLIGNTERCQMTESNIAAIPANHQPATPIEVTGQHFAYIGDGRVQVALQTDTGNVVAFTMSSAAFAKSIDMAVQCMNSNLSKVLTDINVFV